MGAACCSGGPRYIASAAWAGRARKLLHGPPLLLFKLRPFRTLNSLSRALLRVLFALLPLLLRVLPKSRNCDIFFLSHVEVRDIAQLARERPSFFMPGMLIWCRHRVCHFAAAAGCFFFSSLFFLSLSLTRGTSNFFVCSFCKLATSTAAASEKLLFQLTRPDVLRVYSGLSLLCLLPCLTVEMGWIS